MPGVVVIPVTQVVLPKSLEIAGVPVTTLTIPVAALAIGVGALFVYLTPAYTIIGIILPRESRALEELSEFVSDFGSFSTDSDGDPYWFEFPGDPDDFNFRGDQVRLARDYSRRG